jgi:hypothetical protein
MVSSVRAISETWDFDSRSMPSPPTPGHVLDSAGGDPLEVALGHHRHQRPLRLPAGLEQPLGEVAARAQLGDGELDGAGPGVEGPGPVAVAPVGALLAALAVGRVAQGVGRHQLLGEDLDHLADQVAAALVVEVLAQPGQGVHLVGDHRTPLRFVFARDFLRLLRWSSRVGDPRLPGGEGYPSYTTPMGSNTRGQQRGSGTGRPRRCSPSSDRYSRYGGDG